MAATPYSRFNLGDRFLGVVQNQRNLVFGVILGVALIGFEIFNYSTTEMALRDLLGELRFAGIRWATILAVAFCGIDFAGIARLFLPDDHDAKEGWYLLGAWLIAATMNAVLTWWSISLGLVNRTLQSSAFISNQVLIEVIPVFIAVLVWITRILLIGAFSFSGQVRLEAGIQRRIDQRMPARPQTHPAARAGEPQPLRLTRQGNPRTTEIRPPTPAARPEPEYISEPLDGSYAPMQASNRQSVQKSETSVWR